MARALLVLALLAAPAAADPVKADFAAGMRIEESAILEVQDFTLAAGPYHRAILGRFEHRDLVIGGVVMTWCDRAKKCWLADAWLQQADTVELLGILDLAGGPARFPRHRIDRYADPAALAVQKAKFPALVVRVTEREQMTKSSRYGGSKTGEHRRTELILVSLAAKDTRSPELMRVVEDERWPTGSGVSVSFEIAKDGVIVATEQRHLEDASMCLPPEPTTTRYILDKEARRFEQAHLPARTGC